MFRGGGILLPDVFTRRRRRDGERESGSKLGSSHDVASSTSHLFTFVMGEGLPP